MGITVRLQDERGKPEGDHDIGIDFHIPTGDVSFRLLSYIDPYGDTIFNRLQMKTFLAEWEAIKAEAITEQEMEAWKKTKVLAKKCRDEVHLYLRFIGD